MKNDATPGEQPGPIVPSYYAIIPAPVRYDHRIHPGAKLLYGEITALANFYGYCFASNEYFAALYSVTADCIRKWVTELVNCNYLRREIVYEDGTKKVLGRKLFIISEGLQNGGSVALQNDGSVGYIHTVLQATEPRFWYNNTRSNNISSPLDEGFVNQDFGARAEEMIFWLKGKKGLKHMPPQGWLELFAELQINGIPLEEFPAFYEWVENLEWRTGIVNEKLLRGQVEYYIKRDEFDAKKRQTKRKSGGKNEVGNGRGSERVHPAELLREISQENEEDNHEIEARIRLHRDGQKRRDGSGNRVGQLDKSP